MQGINTTQLLICAAKKMQRRYPLLKSSLDAIRGSAYTVVIYTHILSNMGERHMDYISAAGGKPHRRCAALRTRLDDTQGDGQATGREDQKRQVQKDPKRKPCKRIVYGS